jgi:endoglucanase
MVSNSISVWNARVTGLCLCAVILMNTSSVFATDVAEVLPLTSRWLMVHVDEGHVEHHKKGQKRNQEKTIATPLDAAKADDLKTWTITSADDAAYTAGQKPLRVGRKSKGTDFAWITEKWINNRTVNVSLDHAKEHWIYLELPGELKAGCTYSVSSNDLIPAQFKLSFKFDEKVSRSEAVHVNLIGHAPAAPAKFAYVYHWMGNFGSLDVKPLAGRSFHLINQATGSAAFTGKVAFRGSKDQPDTLHKTDSPPNGNFSKADICECDFSAFNQPGKYVVSVEGVGCSFPFTIDADVYREAFLTTVRGLYHNRSGIELKKPFTEFERPAPHNPKLTPGFAGKLVYTKSRYIDWTNHDAAPADKPAIEKGIAGPIESAGFYQDAGDWDSYSSHLNVATTLLFAYETAPENFKDGEQNIPESGNGVPDILDEAAWLPRFCKRLRAELISKGYGSGGIGLRVCGDHFGGDGDGVPSYLDVNRQWIASGEDPVSTYRYAGAAAHLAWCLKLAKVEDPEKADWEKEARESFEWAQKNTMPGDEKKGVIPHRTYAAAALFRLTGDAKYETQFKADTSSITPKTEVWDDSRYGPWVYALWGSPTARDAATAERIRASVLWSCDKAAIETPSKRALRWGGNWAMPMLVGQQTTPWIMEGIVGYTLAKDSDPAKATAYKAAVYTTCDYFLGTNSLNMTWVTGLGVRHPNYVFHMDAWYNGKDRPHPGIVPYGQWKKDKELGMGPWDNAWPNQTLHPGIDEWPGNERWFDNRCSPLSGEFTIHQNTCFAAATFGWLCAPAKK